MDNDVYVTSSLFNIIRSQIIIPNINIKDNLEVEYAKPDATEYIISFKKESSVTTLPLSHHTNRE